MYISPHFDEPNVEVLHKLIDENPFGILFVHGANGLDANHLPFELSRTGEHGVLHAHVARANPVWQNVANGDEVLVVFSAGDAYISPNWYPSKQEFHKQVPTWNYSVAHAYGRITIRDEENFVRGLVARLTRKHEASQSNPWKMGDSPKEYIDSMLAAIVGIQIDITRLVGKFKLSQNKDARDRENAGRILQSSGEQVIGEAMLTYGTQKSDES